MSIYQSPSSSSKAGESGEASVILFSIFILGMLVIIAGILTGGYVILRKRRWRPFMHARLQENVEISNPMYLNEDLDDDGDDPLERSFTLDSDNVSINILIRLI